ncbi:hypothetical protein GY45DRAFT_585147 [Cubamyces sp. BRFM 1775]|nr:hypothetical protein GY45DRAFT_585147 [Cubamyces sp. BRFM 1775]
MSDKGVGKPWTAYEDDLLRQAVAIHGENDNWKAVALSVPGRTNKACRKRWLHSLSPNVKKTAWTPEEDYLLVSLYSMHGQKWSVIARHIPGRTDDACSKRYREALDPSLKRDEWTPDEDAQLLEAYSRLGGRWGIIGQELNRSGLGCRNRWRMFERRKLVTKRDAAPAPNEGSSSASSSQVPTLTPTPQWTPSHNPVPDPQPWDGRSPQYVTPSMLMNNSPNHAQESRTPAYLPEQILSGAHLTDPSASLPIPHQYQYVPSSFGNPLSHPGSVAHSPNPHGYYSPPIHDPPQASGSSQPVINPPACIFNSGQYQPLPGTGSPGATANRAHNDDVHGHPETHLPPGLQTALSAAAQFPEEPRPTLWAYTPASPSSPSSTSSFGSFPSSPTSEHEDLPDDAAPAESAHDPTTYHPNEVEETQPPLPPPPPPPPPPRKHRDPERPARLSSLLPATADANLRAYACGHRDCWPAHARRSKSAFVTSKELSDHSKYVHNGDLGGTKPFRCALTGCEKSWKSLNGLQYHLQISKVHFQQALAAQLGSSAGHADPGQAADHPSGSQTHGTMMSGSCPANGDDPPVAAQPGSGESGAEGAPRKTRSGRAKAPKVHACPHPGCGKQYKQMSGLRYHLSHGHLEALPMQLDAVPPTLARLVAEKSHTSAVQE